VESPEVLTALGEAYGSPLTVKGVDMARYSRGHYLRRPSDTFDDRHFAMIFFLADGWMPITVNLTAAAAWAAARGKTGATNYSPDPANKSR
jgi:hypothetical protein